MPVNVVSFEGGKLSRLAALRRLKPDVRRIGRRSNVTHVLAVLRPAYLLILETGEVKLPDRSPTGRGDDSPMWLQLIIKKPASDPLSVRRIPVFARTDSQLPARGRRQSMGIFQMELRLSGTDHIEYTTQRPSGEMFGAKSAIAAS